MIDHFRSMSPEQSAITIFSLVLFFSQVLFFPLFPPCAVDSFAFGTLFNINLSSARGWFQFDISLSFGSHLLTTIAIRTSPTAHFFYRHQEHHRHRGGKQFHKTPQPRGRVGTGRVQLIGWFYWILILTLSRFKTHFIHPGRHRTISQPQLI